MHTSVDGPLQRQRLPIVQADVYASPAGMSVDKRLSSGRHRDGVFIVLSMDATQECEQLSAALRCLAADQQQQSPCAADFLCPACDQLLWQPAVLTCGHALCSACLPAPLSSSASCAACQLPVRTAPSTCKLVRHMFCMLGNSDWQCLTFREGLDNAETSSCRRAQLQDALQTLFPADMDQRAQQASRSEPCADQHSESQHDAAPCSEPGSSATQDVDSNETGCSGPAHYGVG